MIKWPLIKFPPINLYSLPRRNNNMKPIMLDMTYDKSTKNTHVYKSNDENSHVPTLYINKNAFDDVSAPGVIKITVTDTYENE